MKFAVVAYGFLAQLYANRNGGGGCVLRSYYCGRPVFDLEYITEFRKWFFCETGELAKIFTHRMRNDLVKPLYNISRLSKLCCYLENRFKKIKKEV